MSVVIVDYGMGNLASVCRAVEECGFSAEISGSPADLETATHIILPGVGAFADAMAEIHQRQLTEPLRHAALDSKVPLLGICLGMQLLASEGFEDRPCQGLDLIGGSVVRMEPADSGERIPHVGWNEVRFSQQSPLFSGIPNAADYYFVHSFHFVAEQAGDVLAHTPYAGGFASVIGRENVFGTQFHPEKSGRLGLALLKNFLNYWGPA